MIFNIGLPKTGTTSLNKALQLLGIPSCHNPTAWRQHIVNHGTVDLCEELQLGEFQAFTNFGEHFYPELDIGYPESKFILTLRDRGEWLTSCERWFTPLPAGFKKVTFEIRESIFGVTRFDRKVFTEVYDSHYQGVLDYFEERPQDLLVFGSPYGWGPLCEFLGKKVPKVKYPWEHSGLRTGDSGFKPAPGNHNTESEQSDG